MFEVVPAAITTINSVKPRRKPRVEQRRRPTSEEYEDIENAMTERHLSDYTLISSLQSLNLLNQHKFNSIHLINSLN